MLGGRERPRGHPFLGCSTFRARNNCLGASHCRIEGLWEKKWPNCHQASTGSIELMVEVSPPRPPGTDGLPRPQRIPPSRQGLPVKLGYATAHCSSEPPHFHGNNMFITNVLLLLLLGSSWDSSLTSPGLFFLLLQLISSFTSSWSWQVGERHKDLGIKYFITRQCRILTGTVNSKCPLCEGKWTNLWHTALLVSTREGKSQGDISPACIQTPITNKA